MKFLERLEKILFYLLVFAIPLGTRKVLYEWPQPASAAGRFFNEWESVSFWLTDGLFLFLILTWILNGGLVRIKNKALAVFLILAGLSLLAAENFGLGFYHWLRLGEMILFFIYVKERFSFFNFKRITGIFIASAVFQSFIAVGQAMMQKNLGLWFLGEGPLGPGMINVAKFVSQGTRVLRSYGTLPHPNVLAAILAVAIFFLLYWYFSENKKRGLSRQLFIFVPVYFVLLFALFLTFSRGITLIFLFVLAGWFFRLLAPSKPQEECERITDRAEGDAVRKNKGIIRSLTWFCAGLSKDKKTLGLKIFYALIVLTITYSLLGTVFYRKAVIDRYWTTFSYREEAVSFRMFYNGLALKMIATNPVLGVGIGNFVPRMDEFLAKPLQPWLYQPVHNIFLLVGAEIGLFGLAAFIWFLFPFARNIWPKMKKAEEGFLKNSLFFFLFSALMLFSLFDHFFLTLQPAKLTFWLVLGMLGSEFPIRSFLANKK